MDYVTARRAWDFDAERIANIADQSDDPDALDRLYEAYDAFVMQWIVPELRGEIVSKVATPPDHDPQKTTIERVAKTRDIVRVTTHEAVREGEEGPYEYWLRLVDGEWRLADRRCPGMGRNWLRYLF